MATTVKRLFVIYALIMQSCYLSSSPMCTADMMTEFRADATSNDYNFPEPFINFVQPNPQAYAISTWEVS